jgi:hypothetical protein
MAWRCEHRHIPRRPRCDVRVDGAERAGMTREWGGETGSRGLRPTPSPLLVGPGDTGGCEASAPASLACSRVPTGRPALPDGRAGRDAAQRPEGNEGDSVKNSTRWRRSMASACWSRTEPWPCSTAWWSSSRGSCRIGCTRSSWAPRASDPRESTSPHCGPGRAVAWLRGDEPLGGGWRPSSPARRVSGESSPRGRVSEEAGPPAVADTGSSCRPPRD